MRKLMLLVCAVLAFMPSQWFSVDAAQSAGEQKTIWSGVYTDTQAAKGESIYAEFCSKCHASNLQGGNFDGAPPLKGDKFLDNWREDNLKSLFTKILTTMPRQNASKVLSEDETIALMSYIFKGNEFPTGTELSTKNLEAIQIQRKDGAKPLPNYAKVQALGCMSQDGDNWVLTNASLTRDRTTETSPPTDLKASDARPLGNQSFRLQNLIMLGDFKPEAHKDHKMLARGALLRQGNVERISVTDLQMVSSNCSR